MAIRTIQHVPKKFRPFGFTAQLDVTGGSKLTQTYGSNGGGYSPNHATQPVIFRAVYDIQFSDIERTVEVKVADSPTDTDAKKGWFIDGTSLYALTTRATDPWTSDHYSLSDDGLTLSIKKNLGNGESMSVCCKLRFRDMATQDVCFFTTDPEVMTSVSLAESQYTLQLDSNQVLYDSESDDRTEYEYCAARGLTTPTTEAQSWEDSYMKTREVIVAKGNSGRMTSGYGYEIQDADGEVVAEFLPDGTVNIGDLLRFAELTQTSFTMNCQTVTEGGTTYTVHLLLPDGSGTKKNGAKASFTAKRIHPHKFSQYHENRAPVSADDSEYLLKAKITLNGEEQANPEAYFDIDHFVCQASSSGAISNVKYKGTGVSVTVNPQDEGVSDNSGMTQGMSVDYKQARKALTIPLDASNNYSASGDNVQVMISGKRVLIAQHSFS